MRSALVVGGAANALSVTRSLARRGIIVDVVGNADTAPVARSRACASFVRLASGHLSEYRDWLLGRPGDGAVVLPCSDDAVEFIARDRQALVADGYLPVEANDTALLAMLDKETTYELARAAGIGAPRTAVVEEPADAAAAAETIGFPAALKPRFSHRFAHVFRGKAIPVDDLESLQRGLRMTAAAGLEMILTEIVNGPEDRYWGYYSYFDENGAPLFELTKRKLRQYPRGFGEGTLHVTADSSEVAEAGRRFCTHVGLRGIVNLEFKLDDQSGELKLIECNPRFTAANELVLAAGIDLASLAYDRLVGVRNPVSRPARSAVWLWRPARDTASALALIRRGELDVPTWIGHLPRRPRFPLFEVADPLPSGVAALQNAKKLAWQFVAPSADPEGGWD